MTNECYIQIWPQRCQITKKKLSRNVLEKQLQQTLDRQEIGIGFCGCNPILMNSKIIDFNFNETYPENKKNYTKRMFRYFIEDMKIGDTVYLKFGQKILYKAIIDSDYYFNDNDYFRNNTEESILNNNWFWRHRRKIKDIQEIDEINKGKARQTLYLKKI